MQSTLKKLLNCITITAMTLCMCACTARSSSVVKNDRINTEAETMELQYAHGFSIDRIEDYFYITTTEQKILVIPEGKDIPDWLENENDVVILRQPIDNTYVAATSVPDLIDCIGKLDNVSYTSTTLEDWELASMKEALNDLSIEYVGKYKAPDYEVLLANKCSLAIESTMIYHNPEVKEKLEALGIPVIIDASSYESDPLGRLEWIKVYGALFGCYDEAVEIFDSKVALLEDLYSRDTSSADRKTVAFFYINSNGSVVVRKPGDYVTKMIELAGGEYIINSVPEEDNALSTMNMQQEAFYKEAKDTDILIYNSTIDGEINTFDELFQKWELLKDFKAVKTGNVWCSGKNMFQESSDIAEMIEDMNRLFNGEEELTYFHRIKE